MEHYRDNLPSEFINLSSIGIGQTGGYYETITQTSLRPNVDRPDAPHSGAGLRINRHFGANQYTENFRQGFQRGSGK